MSDYAVQILRCPCGTEIAAGLLSCPACQRLVYADQLKQLAAEAQAAYQTGDISGALRAWRQTLDLLPPDSRQQAVVQARVRELSEKLEAAGRPDAQPRAGQRRWQGPAALAAGLMVLLSKGKFLLAGLTKGGTFLTMFLSLGVYWTAWGWKFALGLIVSMYVHEMGHVAALVRYGIKATPPMFLPGIGAVIRLKQDVLSPRENARMGLAGPSWGLAAAAVAYGAYMAAGWPSWAAIARVGAWINLFNLLPISPLDGGRGFASMSRGQRILAAAAIAAAWHYAEDGLFALLLIAAIAVALGGKSNERGDYFAFGQYVCLLAGLSAILVVCPV